MYVFRPYTDSLFNWINNNEYINTYFIKMFLFYSWHNNMNRWKQHEAYEDLLLFWLSLSVLSVTKLYINSHLKPCIKSNINLKKTINP